LNHANQYTVGLALCTLGNIASVEMARDLFPEVETIIASANPYIRRKAALCAMRICRKVPDLQEHFLDKTATTVFCCVVSHWSPACVRPTRLKTTRTASGMSSDLRCRLW
jgi:vesicle coat complex subunit